MEEGWRQSVHGETTGIDGHLETNQEVTAMEIPRTL